tara:strand:- start:289 stop:435 length:147 start_codon:yes stop_codon:yes gene_type:complete
MIKKMVGVTGFEPVTPRSQSECATAAPHPVIKHFIHKIQSKTYENNKN